MSMATKLVILDMDGVLILSKKLYLEAFKKELAPYGINYTEKMIDDYEADPTHKNEHRAVIRFTLPPEKQEFAEKIGDAVDVFLAENWKRLTKPTPGAREAIEKIRASGAVVGVITFANREYAEEVMKFVGISGALDFLLTEEDGFADKSIAMKEMMKKHGTKGNETVYVGDVMADFLVAQRTGCNFVGFALPGGFNTCEQLLSIGAKVVISNMKELAKAAKVAGNSAYFKP